jgi:iron complex transport system substrate-binding protein
MHRLSSIRFFSLLLVGMLLLGACAPAAPASTPTLAPTATPTGITLTDGLGNKVTLAEPAKRIVSLAPSNTEILFALGAGSQVVGRDEFSDYPAEAKALPSIGGSFSKINNEAIVNLKPDLVLAAEINAPEQTKALQDLGLTVYYLSNPKDFPGLYTNLETVGKLTGHEAEAATFNDTLKKRVAAVTEQVAKATDKPTAFYELDSTDPNAPYTAGPGTFISIMMDMAGGKNVADSAKSAYPQLSLEQVVALNPQIILLGDAAYGVTVESVGKRAGWEALDAVKNNRIYTFDDNLVSRPGPRMVDGLETLAKLLHPELFK